MNLEVRNLSMHYGEERALDRMNLSIKDLDSVSIIGPSGGGKSTLLRLVAGLEIPSSGEVIVNGTPIDYEERALREYRKRIGLVFQSHNLFPHWTAIQNIVLPLIKVFHYEKEAAYEAAESLLVKFGLMEHADKLPVQLSGGQQQRISIARAMARQPEILLLDEPTSALDPQLTKEVLDMLIELKAEGTNILMATHEMNFAKKASEYVVFIDGGKVAVEGPTESFFSINNEAKLGEFLANVFE
ncbi:MAG TPA: ATP-binding cassette domain-containing protein [Clostridia bacterium]|nr:ATP-binding cassette domain-containing protein [Clostridia bacterium]